RCYGSCLASTVSRSISQSTFLNVSGEPIMKNTQLKKALCAILATMLMLTATGCQQATTEDTTSANNTQSAAEQTAESETTSEESKSDSETEEETAEESGPIERNSPYVD